MWLIILYTISSYLPICIKTISVIEKAEMVYQGFEWASVFLKSTFQKKLTSEEEDDWVMIEQ